MRFTFIVLAIFLVAVIATPTQAAGLQVRFENPVIATTFVGDVAGNVYAINGSKVTLLYTFQVKSSETEVAVRRIAHRVRLDGRVELTVLTDDERWVALVLNQTRTRVADVRGPFEARGQEALLVTKSSVQTGGDDYMETVGYDRQTGVLQSSSSLERTIGMARVGKDLFVLQRGVGLVRLPQGNVDQAELFGNVRGTAMAIARSGRMIFVLHGSYGDTPGGIEALDAKTGEFRFVLKSTMASNLGLPYGRVLGFTADDSAVYVLSYEGNATKIVVIPYEGVGDGAHFEYPVMVAESSVLLCGLDVVP